MGNKFENRLLKFSVFVISLFLIAAFIQIHSINSQINLLENKLGGSTQLMCNEKDTINKLRQSVVRVVGGESEGSGFAVNNGGVILTNFHVIEFEPSPKVVMPDNTFETATVIMADKNADLALLQIKKVLPVVTWGNSNDLNPGDELLAIGFPLGGELSGESSVNIGYLAGRRHDAINNEDFIQTDATLNPGVSGGPMVNICGDVEAINTAGTAGLGILVTRFRTPC